MLVKLHNQDWLKRQIIAGQCVAKVLQSSFDLIKTKPSLKDIESNAVSIIKEFGCTPTFLNYKGFPSAICVSVNKMLVHGIVSDYILKDGDLITVDLGATYEGAIADAAYTYIVGEVDKRVYEMLKICQDSLMAGVAAAVNGNRLGDIGFAVSKVVDKSGFGLVTEYGGHGLDYNKPHAEPFVANKGKSGSGIPLLPGMTIAIEPMVTFTRDTKTKTLSDNWSVMADSLCCHFEHSVFIDNGHTHIVTEHGMKY